MIGAMASSFLDPRNTSVHVHAGGAQQQVWAEPHVCEQRHVCVSSCVCRHVMGSDVIKHSSRAALPVL